MPEAIKAPPAIQFTVAIDWENDPRTLAVDFAKRLNPAAPGFDEALFLALGKPESALPAFTVRPLPSYLTAYEQSWRFSAQRYVQLKYDGALSPDLIRQTLRRSNRFGFIGLDSGTRFHSPEVPALVIPTDPLWSAQSGLTAPYDSARWPYEQLNFTGAWD